MGAYYGIRNYTKKQKINCYQKGTDYDNYQLNIFAHAFNWKPYNVIVTASYDDMQVRFYCSDINDWKIADPNVPPTSNQEPDNTNDESEYNGEHFDDNYSILAQTHYPTFDENGKCTQCELCTLDNTALEQRAKQFSAVFYMN